jgi:hypothetical protein
MDDSLRDAVEAAVHATGLSRAQLVDQALRADPDIAAALAAQETAGPTT